MDREILAIGWRSIQTRWMFPIRKALPSVAAGVAVLLCFGVSPGCRSAGEKAAEADALKGSRPNVVFIITDDQGYGEIGAHGNPILKTPNLDRLHRESVRFTQFHVSPTCAPTRAALMTGKHEFRSGVTHTIFERERLSLKAVTLAETLRTSGYRTGIFGKWHLGDEDEYLPARRGFDESFIHGAGGIGQTYPGSCGDAPNNTYHDPWIWHNDHFVKTKGYCTDVFLEQASRWIEERNRNNERFMAWISPNVPHDPFISPGAEWEAPYRNAGLSTNAVRYYAMIAHLDAAVGRLLTGLERMGLAEDTLVVFMTDNGHSVGNVYNAGMRGMKGGPYQGGTRVPSFWRWPAKLPAGVDCEALTAHVDFLPTLLELAGEKIPAGIDGRSLVPLLEQARTQSHRGDQTLTRPELAAVWPDRFLFTHVGRWEVGDAEKARFRGAAVRNKRFKLVNNVELYDLAADHSETNNVISAHPVVTAELRAVFEKWWAEVLPLALEQEAVRGPAVNPFKERFWAQLGKPPGTNSWDWKMNPDLKFDRKRPGL